VHACKVDGLVLVCITIDSEEHIWMCCGSRMKSERILRTWSSRTCEERRRRLFSSPLFRRSTFKVWDRGYRFILFEAGHLAQIANLTAAEKGLITTNVGGIPIAGLNRYLGIDGLNEIRDLSVTVGSSGRRESPGTSRSLNVN